MGWESFDEVDAPGALSGASTDPGLDFFTWQEKVSGAIQGEHNPSEPYFPNDMGEIQFVAKGPAFMGFAIRKAVQQALAAKGFTWVEVATLETPVFEVAGIPIYGDYKVRAYFHGSPLVLPVLGLIWYVLAGALALLSVSIVVWQITSTIQSGEQTKRIALTKEVVVAMPESTPEERKAKSEAGQKAIDAITQHGGTLAPSPPSKGPLDQFQDIGKLALWGGVIYLGLMALGTVKDITRK